MFLTHAGKLLLQFADELHRLSEEAENQMACQSGGATGELVLGASTTIAQYVLPAALAEFSGRYPEIHQQVFSENTGQISQRMASGRFGLGLIEGAPLRTESQGRTWFDDELLIVVPASHDGPS